MRIDLSESLEFRLAVILAENIHACIVRAHLRAVSGILPGDSGQFATHRDDICAAYIAECRAVVRSIRGSSERKAFIGRLRFLLGSIRTNRGTPSKWQDYAAAVRRYAATVTT